VHTAELSFEYRSPAAAALIEDAVAVEVGEIDGDRATASVRRRGGTLRIEIDADDLVALRAGLNTWETLVEVAERAVGAGRDGEDL
jgi:KEOPS complex subunit Pcc1